MFRKSLLLCSSIAHGFISCYWILFAVMFAFPESAPGEKEWGEDVTFIPIGYIMMLMWLLVTGFLIMRLRKSKWQMIACIITFIITVGIVFLGMLY